ncbi:MAG: fibronectin type III domain-containing protein [Candidatus Thermoplasmatota archaeon]|nr:fibronectin type III domain-containing protein [Candidatus Thermoplasmatota archaeon]
MRFEGSDLKSEFLVHPGGDPNLIRIRYDNAIIGISNDIELNILCNGLLFREGPLIVYQGDRMIKAEYVLNGPFVAISLGEYDLDRTLVIDPLLSSSTFIGGSGWDKEPRIILDDEENVYLAGVTDSYDLPVTPGSHHGYNNGNDDIFICRMKEDLSSIYWLTYFGGLGYESIADISLLKNGDPVIAGSTTSEDLPKTFGVVNNTYRGGTTDGFIATFSREDGNLEASSYIGGSDRDRITSLTVNGNGSPVIAGHSASSDLYIDPNAYSRVIKGEEDSFIMVLSPDLSTVQASTLIGGSRYPDRIFTVTTLEDDRILVAGQALSSDYPVTSGVIREKYGSYSGFVTMFDPNLTMMIRSTFTGNGSWINSVAIHDNLFYLTGKVMSASYPTTEDALDRTFDGEEDAFLTIVSSDMTSLVYSTFIGADEKYGGQYYYSYYEGASDITIGPDGKIYLCGYTDSTHFPITLGAYDTTRNELDFFFMILSADGRKILHSTFLGGADEDRATAIAFQGENNVLIAGHTYFNTLDSDFPTTLGAYDTSFNGGYDITLTKFKLDSDIPSKVSSLVIDNGTNYLHVSWEEPLNDGNEPLLGYRIYRSTDPGDPQFFLEQSVEDLNDTSVIKGAETYYWISAINKVGEGERTMVYGTAYSIPSSPTTISSRIGDGTINLTWEPPLDTGGFSQLTYNIYLSKDEHQILEIRDVTQHWFLLSGLENGMDHYIRLSASNSLGEGPLSYPSHATPLGLPTSVENLTYIPMSSALLIRWNPPSSKGGAYQVHYALYLGNVINQILKTYIDLEMTELMIEGLVNGRYYTVSVAAYNDLGKGERAYLHNITPLGMMTEVADIDIYQINKSIILQWGPPENTGGAVNITYNIYQKGDEGTSFLIKEEHSTEKFIIDDVEYGREYSFKIGAHNGYFEGELSPFVSIIPYGLPSPPIDFSLENVDDTVNLSWNEPIDLGGDIEATYNIHMSIDNGPLYLLSSTSFMNSTITNLKKGTRHGFAISTVNIKGEGELTEVLNCTPTSVPGPPIDLKYQISSEVIELAWSKPQDDGGLKDITYEVWMGRSPENIDVMRTGLDSRNCTVEGLNNGWTYYFAVRAVNIKGSSSFSDVIPAVPQTYPDPPVILEVISGDGWIEIVWEPPQNNGGGDIWIYHIFIGVEPSNLTLSRSASPSTRSYRLSGLTNGRSYYLALSCETSFGMSQITESYEATPSKEISKDKTPNTMILFIITLSVIVILSVLLYILKGRSVPRSKGRPRSRRYDEE